MLCDNSDKDFSVTLPSGVVVCCNKKTVYVQPYNSEKSDLFSVIIDKQEKNQIEIFNKKFDISFYDIPVELYVETDEMPRISNGCYSVVSQRWLSEPSLSDIPEVDQATIDKVFQE